MGSHHMRSKLIKAPPLFTDYLKKAGYTICWPKAGGIGKTDFNFDPPQGLVGCHRGLDGEARGAQAAVLRGVQHHRLAREPGAGEPLPVREEHRPPQTRPSATTPTG